MGRVEGRLDLPKAEQGQLLVAGRLDRRPGEQPGEEPRRVAPRLVAVPAAEHHHEGSALPAHEIDDEAVAGEQPLGG